MRRLIVAGVFLCVVSSGVSAYAVDYSGGTPYYVLGNSTVSTTYGAFGQAYCYSWPTYQNENKHVESVYCRRDDFTFVEMGIENSVFSQYENWIEWRSVNPATMILAWQCEPWISYHKAWLAPATPDTWIQFEVNNHQPYLGAGSNWYAAWNGNTVLHGLQMTGFYGGTALGASERFEGADSRSSFRYMQYKTIGSLWYAWPGTVFDDHDVAYSPSMVPGFTNRFYMSLGM